MFGSGVAIGMEVTRRVRRPIRLDHRPINTASGVGGAGTSMHRTAVLLIVAAALHRTAAAMTASVWFVSHSLKYAICNGKQVKWNKTCERLQLTSLSNKFFVRQVFFVFFWGGEIVFMCFGEVVFEYFG